MAGETMNSAMLLQLIKEATPGTYDPAGERRVMIGLRGDFQPEEEWANHRPSGFNVDSWNAMAKSHRVWSGSIAWDWGDLQFLLPLIAGAPTDEDSSGGTDTLTYELVEAGDRDAETVTLEYGLRTSCDRCTYGLLVSLSGAPSRDGTKVEGQITFLCRKPESEGVPMTGMQEVQSFIADAGDDGDYTINGSAAFKLGDSLSSIQTKVRATGGNYANVVITGSSVAPVP